MSRKQRFVAGPRLKRSEKGQSVAQLPGPDRAARGSALGSWHDLSTGDRRPSLSGDSMLMPLIPLLTAYTRALDRLWTRLHGSINPDTGPITHNVLHSNKYDSLSPTYAPTWCLAEVKDPHGVRRDHILPTRQIFMVCSNYLDNGPRK